jgi:oxygen-independent coproporphyrinogen-3 oxidase
VVSTSVGLYLHVPFCVTLCPYCAFYKVPYTATASDEYINQLIREMVAVRQYYGDVDVDTIFFGGGTPNVLSRDQMGRIVAAIHANFNVAAHVEFSMEMNPGIHSKSKLNFFKRMGVNRVSIGVQSFVDRVLMEYGRQHTVDQTIDFIHDVWSVGQTNISVDIMFGYSGHGRPELDASLEKVLAYQIPHVALYGLTILTGTPFYDRFVRVDDDAQADQYAHIQACLTSCGYTQYEVSNFCLDGFECDHNIKYWTFKNTIGLGPGAHSYMNGRPYKNTKNYQSYHVQQSKAGSGFTQDVRLYLATRLRYLRPLSRYDLMQRFNRDVFSLIEPKLKEFSLMGWVNLGEDSVVLSPTGCLLLDELVGHLDLE